MKRGEVWTVRDDLYASKPRPGVIVQSDYDTVGSVILCMMTSFDRPGLDSRVRVEAGASNGLKQTSFVMTDKVMTIPKDRLGSRIGQLSPAQMKAVAIALATLLGLTANDLSEGT